MPLLSVPIKTFSKNIVAVVKSGNSGVVISSGCVSCLELELDNLVEINIAYLNRAEKNSRSVLFCCT